MIPLYTLLQNTTWNVCTDLIFCKFQSTSEEGLQEFCDNLEWVQRLGNQTITISIMNQMTSTRTGPDICQINRCPARVVIS